MLLINFSHLFDGSQIHHNLHFAPFTLLILFSCLALRSERDLADLKVTRERGGLWTPEG